MDQQTDTASLESFTSQTESRKMNTKLVKHKDWCSTAYPNMAVNYQNLYLSCMNYATR